MTVSLMIKTLGLNYLKHKHNSHKQLCVNEEKNSIESTISFSVLERFLKLF